MRLCVTLEKTQAKDACYLHHTLSDSMVKVKHSSLRTLGLYLMKKKKMTLVQFLNFKIN